MATPDLDIPALVASMHTTLSDIHNTIASLSTAPFDARLDALEQQRDAALAAARSAFSAESDMLSKARQSKLEEIQERRRQEDEERERVRRLEDEERMKLEKGEDEGREKLLEERCEGVENEVDGLMDEVEEEAESAMKAGREKLVELDEKRKEINRLIEEQMNRPLPPIPTRPRARTRTRGASLVEPQSKPSEITPAEVQDQKSNDSEKPRESQPSAGEDRSREIPTSPAPTGEEKTQSEASEEALEPNTTNAKDEDEQPTSIIEHEATERDESSEKDDKSTTGLDEVDVSRSVSPSLETADTSTNEDSSSKATHTAPEVDDSPISSSHVEPASAESRPVDLAEPEQAQKSADESDDTVAPEASVQAAAVSVHETEGEQESESEPDAISKSVEESTVLDTPDTSSRTTPDTTILDHTLDAPTSMEPPHEDDDDHKADGRQNEIIDEDSGDVMETKSDVLGGGDHVDDHETHTNEEVEDAKDTSAANELPEAEATRDGEREENGELIAQPAEVQDTASAAVAESHEPAQQPDHDLSTGDDDVIDDGENSADRTLPEVHQPDPEEFDLKSGTEPIPGTMTHGAEPSAVAAETPEVAAPEGGKDGDDDDATHATTETASQNFDNVNASIPDTTPEGDDHASLIGSETQQADQSENIETAGPSSETNNDDDSFESRVTEEPGAEDIEAEDDNDSESPKSVREQDIEASEPGQNATLDDAHDGLSDSEEPKSAEIVTRADSSHEEAEPTADMVANREMPEAQNSAFKEDETHASEDMDGSHRSENNDAGEIDTTESGLPVSSSKDSSHESGNVESDIDETKGQSHDDHLTDERVVDLNAAVEDTNPSETESPAQVQNNDHKVAHAEDEDVDAASHPPTDEDEVSAADHEVEFAPDKTEASSEQNHEHFSEEDEDVPASMESNLEHTPSNDALTTSEVKEAKAPEENENTSNAGVKVDPVADADAAIDTTTSGADDDNNAPPEPIVDQDHERSSDVVSSAEPTQVTEATDDAHVGPTQETADASVVAQEHEAHGVDKQDHLEIASPQIESFASPTPGTETDVFVTPMGMPHDRSDLDLGTEEDDELQHDASSESPVASQAEAAEHEKFPIMPGAFTEASTPAVDEEEQARDLQRRLTLESEMSTTVNGQDDLFDDDDDDNSMYDHEEDGQQERNDAAVRIDQDGDGIGRDQEHFSVEQAEHAVLHEHEDHEDSGPIKEQHVIVPDGGDADDDEPRTAVPADLAKHQEIDNTSDDHESDEPTSNDHQVHEEDQRHNMSSPTMDSGYRSESPQREEEHQPTKDSEALDSADADDEDSHTTPHLAPHQPAAGFEISPLSLRQPGTPTNTISSPCKGLSASRHAPVNQSPPSLQQHPQPQAEISSPTRSPFSATSSPFVQDPEHQTDSHHLNSEATPTTETHPRHGDEFHEDEASLFMPRDVTNVPWAARARTDSEAVSLHSATTLSSAPSSPVHAALQRDNHEPVIRDSWPPQPRDSGVFNYNSGMGGGGEYDPFRAGRYRDSMSSEAGLGGGKSPSREFDSGNARGPSTPPRMGGEESPTKRNVGANGSPASLFQKMRNIFEQPASSDPQGSPARSRPVSAAWLPAIARPHDGEEFERKSLLDDERADR